MLIWMPRLYTEAHRSPERQSDLIVALSDVGVRCVAHFSPRCDLVFCGSIYCAEEVRRFNRRPALPVVHYNWDLYPHVVKTSKDQDWGSYLADLKTAAKVLVPNDGTARRTTEFVGVGATVVPAPVKVWDVPHKKPAGVPEPYTYLLDVMRSYPWDRSAGVAERVCKRLGIPLVQTLTTRPWDEFRWLAAHATALLSACDEASTGGLSLLEGYAHGAPVILNNSPMNGAGEYFGDRATYFDHTRRIEQAMETTILEFSKSTRMIDRREQRKWVESNYSDAIFASRLREEFELCLNPSAQTLGRSAPSTKSSTKTAT